MPGFERRGETLVCDGVSLQDAAAGHGTPLYVYSRAAVEEAYAAYDRAFAAVLPASYFAELAQRDLASFGETRFAEADPDGVPPVTW